MNNKVTDSEEIVSDILMCFIRLNLYGFFLCLDADLKENLTIVLVASTIFC